MHFLQVADKGGGRAVAERYCAPGHAQPVAEPAEHGPHRLLGRPHPRGRRLRRWRRQVTGHDPRGLPGHALRRPARHRQHPAQLAYPGHLRRHPPLVWGQRQRPADGGQHPVKVIGGERQVLGIRRSPRHGHTGLGGAPPTRPEQVIGQVDCGHLRSPPSSQDRRVAASRAQVQHPHARPDTGRLDHRSAHPRELLRHPAVIPFGPQRPVHAQSLLIVPRRPSLAHRGMETPLAPRGQRLGCTVPASGARGGGAGGGGAGGGDSCRGRGGCSRSGRCCR